MSGISRKEAADGGPAVRLFCFPHAGGSAASLNGWIRRLPSTIALERVELPGRVPDAAEAPQTCIENVMPGLWRKLADRLDRPFALYGHSLGALVAYEFARCARAHGFGSPLALFVSGRRAPQCPLTLNSLYDLPEPELMERLAEFGGTPDGVIRNATWRRYLLPALRADLEMSDRYEHRPDAPLDCPIFAFRGRADSIASEAEIHAWGAQSTGHFAAETLPGGHFFTNDGIERISEVIVSQLLERKAADSPVGSGAAGARTAAGASERKELNAVWSQ